MSDDEADAPAEESGNGDPDEQDGAADGEEDGAPLADIADDVRERRPTDAGRDTDDGDDAADRSAAAESSWDAADGVDAADDADAEDLEGGPLADVAAEVGRRRADADADAEDDLFEEAFSDVSVDVDDEDEVWDRLDADAEIRDVSGDAATAVDERIVDKQAFCHRCEHFDEPPSMACTHEGTTIVELVDAEHVRVRDCPVVAERERLEGFE